MRWEDKHKADMRRAAKKMSRGALGMSNRCGGDAYCYPECHDCPRLADDCDGSPEYMDRIDEEAEAKPSSIFDMAVAVVKEHGKAISKGEQV